MNAVLFKHQTFVIWSEHDLECASDVNNDYDD